MFIKILIGLVVLLVILAIVIALRPDEFRVTRTAVIPVAAPIVFVQVNNLANWNSWSPWAKLDPNAKYTFEGPISGVGAVLRWAGNNQVGEGAMTIMESRPNELVVFKLEFLKPFQGTNTVEFTFKPEGDQTVVSWTMFGKANFMSKAMGLFMNCEKMCGDQFEQGFANLKTVATAAARK